MAACYHSSHMLSVCTTTPHHTTPRVAHAHSLVSWWLQVETWKAGPGLVP